MSPKRLLIVATAIIVATIAFTVMGVVDYNLSKERSRLQRNTEILISDCERYRTSDSLSGARVQALELNLKEFERFRAEDAARIKELKAKNYDLSQVNKTQAQTIIRLQSIPRDTVVLVDSIPIPAKAVHCGDAWFDFNGVLTAESFSGELRNRDSLMMMETVKYKRFLGFLWKTKKIKDRKLDVISKNPHTEIIGLEHLVIEK